MQATALVTGGDSVSVTAVTPPTIKLRRCGIVDVLRKHWFGGVGPSTDRTRTASPVSRSGSCTCCGHGRATGLVGTTLCQQPVTASGALLVWRLRGQHAGSGASTSFPRMRNSSNKKKASRRERNRRRSRSSSSQRQQPAVQLWRQEM